MDNELLYTAVSTACFTAGLIIGFFLSISYKKSKHTTLAKLEREAQNDDC